MLSGPEPQRTLLEKIMLSQLRGFTESVTMLLGRPDKTEIVKISDNIIVLPHATAYVTSQMIKNAEFVICRGGYTTIMELVNLKKRSFLIPTPGQTEQEYLCQKLSGEGLFLSSAQKSFNLRQAIDKLKNFKPADFRSDNGLLSKAIAESV
jgi:predicted glycosyltransferase